MAHHDIRLHQIGNEVRNILLGSYICNQQQHRYKLLRWHRVGSRIHQSQSHSLFLCILVGTCIGSCLYHQCILLHLSKGYCSIH